MTELRHHIARWRGGPPGAARLPGPRLNHLQAYLAINEGDSGLQLYVNFELFWITKQNTTVPKFVIVCKTELLR